MSLLCMLLQLSPRKKRILFSHSMYSTYLKEVLYVFSHHMFDLEFNHTQTPVNTLRFIGVIRLFT